MATAAAKGEVSLWPVRSGRHAVSKWSTSVLGDHRKPSEMGPSQGMVPGSADFSLDVRTHRLTQTRFPTRRYADRVTRVRRLSKKQLTQLIDALSAIQCKPATYTGEEGVSLDNWAGSHTLFVQVYRTNRKGCFVFNDSDEPGRGLADKDYPYFTLPKQCGHDYFLQLLQPYFT